MKEVLLVLNSCHYCQEAVSDAYGTICPSCSLVYDSLPYDDDEGLPQPGERPTL